MTDAGWETLVTVLGLPREAGLLYDRVRGYSGLPLDQVAAHLELTDEDLRRQLEPLAEPGIVVEEDGCLYVRSPAQAVTGLLTEMAAGAEQAHARLIEISRALPFIAGAGARIPDAYVAEERPLDGESVAQVNATETIRALVRSSYGQMRWLRPQLWARAYEDDMIDLVAEAVGQGRRCRGVYPLRVLSEAPVALAARAEVGEEIRVLPEVPTRLLILGTTHALLPEPLGGTEPLRLVVRQRGLVEAVTLLFESLWRQAVPVAELDAGPGGARGQRRFLLEQLAVGAQDEQIARRLGVSLRTVRRRVAELMEELDAQSRFQAGVEAVRRGWL